MRWPKFGFMAFWDTWVYVGQWTCWCVAPHTILLNNKVRTKVVHLRDKRFQHLWAVGHPNHPDFSLNKMDTCLTVYGYTSRNRNTFTKSLAIYVQSFVQNLFLFPMFRRDSIVLSVKWSWELDKLFICKNLLISDLLLLNVSTLF